MYNKRNWAYAEVASDDTRDSVTAPPARRIRKPTAVASDASWQRYNSTQAMVGHVSREAASSSSRSILELTRPPKGLAAAAGAKGGQMGYWAADLERILDEINGGTPTTFFARGTPPPRRRACDLLRALAMMLPWLHPCPLTACSPFPPRAGPDQVVHALYKKRPANSFEGMLDALTKGGAKVSLKAVHPDTAASLLRGAGEGTVTVSGNVVTRTSGWTGDSHKRKRDLVAYVFLSTRAWLEWGGQLRTSATATANGFDTIVSPHGRMLTDFGPGHPGHARLVDAGMSPVLEVSLALSSDDGSVLESSMETAVGQLAAATGRAVNLMVIDHREVGGELFYLALRVSLDDSDPTCRHYNVTRPPPAAGPTPSGGQTEAQPFVAWGELGWVSASAVNIVRGIDFLEEQVTRLGEGGSPSLRMPSTITLAFQCFYASRAAGVLKWA